MLSGNELSMEQIVEAVFVNGVSSEILLKAHLGLNRQVVALTQELELLNQGSETESGFNQALISMGRFDTYAQNIAATNARKLQLSNAIANCYFMIGHIFRRTEYPMLAQISMQVALEYFPKDNPDNIFVYRSLAEICLKEKYSDAEKFLVEGRDVALAFARRNDSEVIRSYIEWTEKELEKLDKNKYRRIEPARVTGNDTSKSEEEVKQEAVNTVPELLFGGATAKNELTQNTPTVKSRLSYLWALAPVAAAGVAVVVNAALRAKR